MKILVADDDPTSLRLLEHVLPRFGHEAVCARDGGEAWEALKAPGAPRVAILDWMMPVLDGLGVCRRLRKEAGVPYVYVILLSARSQKEDVATGLGAGADDYLVKPCSHQQLRNSLEAAEKAVRARDAGVP